jgi:hypothetical protein
MSSLRYVNEQAKHRDQLTQRRRTMPAKSEKQRRFLFARFGEAWAKRHHFNNKGKLPKQASKKKK